MMFYPFLRTVVISTLISFSYVVMPCEFELVIGGRTIFSLQGAFPYFFSTSYQQVPRTLADRIKNEDDAVDALYDIVTRSGDITLLKELIDHCNQTKIPCSLEHPIDGIRPLIWSVKHRKHAVALELLKTYGVSGKELNPFKLLASHSKKEIFKYLVEHENLNIDELLAQAVKQNHLQNHFLVEELLLLGARYTPKKEDFKNLKKDIFQQLAMTGLEIGKRNKKCYYVALPDGSEVYLDASQSSVAKDFDALWQAYHSVGMNVFRSSDYGDGIEQRGTLARLIQNNAKDHALAIMNALSTNPNYTPCNDRKFIARMLVCTINHNNRELLAELVTRYLKHDAIAYGIWKKMIMVRINNCNDKNAQNILELVEKQSHAPINQ